VSGINSCLSDKRLVPRQPWFITPVSQESTVDAVRVTAADTDEDMADMEADEAVTRRALEEGEEPATADVEGLRRFLEGEVASRCTVDAVAARRQGRACIVGRKRHPRSGDSLVPGRFAELNVADHDPPREKMRQRAHATAVNSSQMPIAGSPCPLDCTSYLSNLVD